MAKAKPARVSASGRAAHSASRAASATPALRQAAALGLTKKQLAETIGLGPEALYKRQRLSAGKTQARLQDMLDILNRVDGWAGGPAQALAWYRGEAIPAFGDRTAESLVKSGQAGALRDYLDSLALGGFA